MIDSLILVLSIIIILCIIVFSSIQRTSFKCSHVFQTPSPQLIKRYIPRTNYTADKPTVDNTESLNDRVNELYMHNPYNKKGNGPGNGMADVSNTHWLSTSSQPNKSNDGRVINDNTESQDMVSPEYINDKMNKITELMSQNLGKSRVLDYQHERK